MDIVEILRWQADKHNHDLEIAAKEIEGLREDNHRLASMVGEVTAKHFKASKDAERYRWLRDIGGDKPGPWVFTRGEWLRRERLDEAIDAAMEGE